MTIRVRLASIAFALMTTTAVAAAQDVSLVGTEPTPAAGPVAAETSTGPRLAGPLAGQTRAGLQARVASASARELAELQPDALRKRGMPQMIIGGAALVGGLIIGDDAGTLVALGGLGFGLYGLYLYLQ